MISNPTTSALILCLLLISGVGRLSSRAAETLQHTQDSKKVTGITRNWDGVLKFGGQNQRLVLKISDAPSGGLQAVVDSPDQPNGNNLQVDTITFQTTSYILK